MKSFIVFALFIAAAVAGPVLQIQSGNPKDATILRYESDNIGVGGYHYEVETSDGKSASEEAIVKNVGLDNEGIEVRGQFSYPGPDGVTYTVTYVANELGFQPLGVHLPQV